VGRVRGSEGAKPKNERDNAEQGEISGKGKGKSCPAPVGNRQKRPRKGRRQKDKERGCWDGIVTVKLFGGRDRSRLDIEEKLKRTRVKANRYTTLFEKKKGDSREKKHEVKEKRGLRLVRGGGKKGCVVLGDRSADRGGGAWGRRPGALGPPQRRPGALEKTKSRMMK